MHGEGSVVDGNGEDDLDDDVPLYVLVMVMTLCSKSLTKGGNHAERTLQEELGFSERKKNTLERVPALACGTQLSYLSR